MARIPQTKRQLDPPLIALAILAAGIGSLLPVLLHTSAGIAIIFAGCVCTVFIVAPAILAPIGRDELLARACLGTFIVFLVALLLWPRYAFIRIPGLPGATPPRLIFLLCIAVWMIWILRDMSRLSRLFTLDAPGLLTWAVSLFFLWRIVSALLSVSVGHSLFVVVSEVALALTCFFIAASLIRSERTEAALFTIIALTTIAATLLALLELRMGRNIFLGLLPINSEYAAEAMQSKFRGGGLRVQSTFSHPLTYAEFMAAAAPLCIALATHTSASAIWRLTGSIAAVCALVGTLLSGSRTGVVAAISASFIFFALSILRGNKQLRADTLVRIALLFIGLSGLVAAGFHSLDFLIGRAASEYYSGLARIEMWEAGLKKAEDSPIYGYGAGMAATVLGYRAGTAGVLTIDSYYLSLLLDSGIVGLGAFVLTGLLATYVALTKSSRTDSPRRVVLLGLASSIIALALVRTTLSLDHNLPIYFALIGTVYAAAVRPTSPAPS